jgi:hypothetical protein
MSSPARGVFLWKKQMKIAITGKELYAYASQYPNALKLSYNKMQIAP